MSFNQSRSDRNDTQNRKSGRSTSFNQQRSSSGAYGRGAGAGPAPPPSVNSSSSVNSNRSGSFQKSNNAQGGQYRVNVPAVSSSEQGTAAVPRKVQNGAHVYPRPHVASDATVANNAPKPTDPITPQRSTPAVPKAPTSQSAAASSESNAPTTPAKDVAKAFPFQFGSISPGFMNGMQIPARTSSAPPNLDEQKRDQARHESLKPTPNLPTPSVPKQQIPRKDADQPSVGVAPQASKSKKSVLVSPVPPATQTYKPSVVPIPKTSMQMPFHPSQVSVQFGAPNAQMQSQSVTATTHQMPMAMQLPVGNSPQVQQQVFVPGLQSHPMPPQGIMHQGQGLSFTPPMGGQLPPQLSHMGLGMAPQYPQQQGVKFGGPRKTTVKITHPDTHEELRLDKRKDNYSDSGAPGSRSHSNIPPHSQPVPSFAPSHPINFYPNSYNASPIFFPPSSMPLTSSQMTPPNSQNPRFNYSVNQGSQNMSFMNPAIHTSVPVNKAGLPMHSIKESSNLEHIRDSHLASSPAPSGTIHVTVKPALASVGEKVSESLTSSSTRVEKGLPNLSQESGDISQSLPEKDKASSGSYAQLLKSGNESPMTKALPGQAEQTVVVTAGSSSENLLPIPVSSASAAQSETKPIVTITEGRRKDALSRSNSIKEQNKTGQKAHPQPQIQFGEQSTSQTVLTSQGSEHGTTPSSVDSEIIDAKAVSTTLHLGVPGISVPTVVVSPSDASNSKPDIVLEGRGHVSSEIKGSSVDSVDAVNRTCLDDTSMQIGQPIKETARCENQLEQNIPVKSAQDSNSIKAAVNKIELITNMDDKSVSNEVPATVTAQGDSISFVNKCQENESVCDNMDFSASRVSDSIDGKNSHGEKIKALDTTSSTTNTTDSTELPVSKPMVSEEQSTQDVSATMCKHEDEVVETISSSQVNLSKDKPVIETNRAKNTIAKGKKKRKEILQKADAAGTTSDLYMAYKGPEEKKEAMVRTASMENVSDGVNLKQESADVLQGADVKGTEIVPNKAEPDDWEDAADISTPKLEALDNGEPLHDRLLPNELGNENMTKKYSRDFLLKFSEHCIDLPDQFKIAKEIVGAFMSANVNTSSVVAQDSFPSPGRTVDRSGGGPRLDRRGSGMGDDDRWNKVAASYGQGRDPHMDLGYGMGFRPGQGGNFGVLGNPRAQSPMQYAGGILSGPMQPMGSQGGMNRNSPDADRWQRSPNYQQKGLIPSPHTPLQIMHKAERRYEVGKATDEEQTKQRQLKAILNKLTPQNFEKLFEQVKAVNIDNAVTLTGVISQIFDKALTEPTFCEMYANFCSHLAGELPDFSEDNEKITFKRLLLDECQEEFERGEREQEEANKVEDEGEVKQSEEEREEKRVKARRRMLGNIRLIGELYKKRMLTERIMHECIKKLLGQFQNPNEEDIESLCKLMSTIGEMIDHPKAKEHMDAYFDRMAKLSNNMKLSSRVRFMLKDAIDLRKNKWQQRMKVEGPKKIADVHRDAAQERQTQASRLARGPGVNQSPRRALMDYGPRGSIMSSSPSSQMGGFRGMPAQTRGFGNQDYRFEERQSYEARTLSVPLPQRPLNDDSITLGPQGGLGRGMSIRGPPVISNTPLADASASGVDSRRMVAGLNGYGPVSDRSNYSSRGDVLPRFTPDRFAGPPPYDQLNAHDRNIGYSNRDLRSSDRSFDRPLATPQPTRGHGSTFIQTVPEENIVPEERLRDMSMAAIKEFYSARDEKEVVLCIKDLNSPSFHPTMISLWVNDSFERKDVERDLLTNLIVNLARECILNQGQLVKGFESVLTTLEDAVNDAPKAAEFLGRMFGKVIVENMIPMKEVGRLIHEGGEEPGGLLEFGLAGDVLGSTMELIKSEKGDAFLKDIRISSNLRVEDFQPRHPNRSRILEKFI